jgi:hypothetical protein
MGAMSQPWMKFYPSDWRADPALRSCSMAARGLWMEMLCLMHEANPRGSLLINGQQVTGKQLASLCGTGLTETVRWLGELAGAGVFSRDENGTIYSRRIRRDDEKALRDKANGKGGGNPALTKGVNPPDKGKDKAQKPEARDQKPEEGTQPPLTQSEESKNFQEFSLGKDGRSQSGPRHGATSEQRRRVYIKAGTPEWDDYAADFRAVHFKDPVPNEHGGKWFNTTGEQRHAG